MTCIRLILALVLAVAGSARAQSVATPPPPKIVDGWTIARTQLGCDARSVAAPFADPYFWIQQSGKQGWDYKPLAAVQTIQDAQFLRTFPRAMVKVYVIDGRRVDATALGPSSDVTQLAAARQVKLEAEGYVDKRSREQLVADYAAKRPTTLEHFRWQTASETLRVPGPSATAALRACAAEPREANRPASVMKRGSSALGMLGLSQDRFISLICRDRSFSGKIAAIDFTLSVSESGELTSLKPVAGTADSASVARVASLLRQSLRISPATNGTGRFVAGTLPYRSPAIDLNCADL